MRKVKFGLKTNLTDLLKVQFSVKINFICKKCCLFWKKKIWFAKSVIRFENKPFWFEKSWIRFENKLFWFPKSWIQFENKLFDFQKVEFCLKINYLISKKLNSSWKQFVFQKVEFCLKTNYLISKTWIRFENKLLVFEKVQFGLKTNYFFSKKLNSVWKQIYLICKRPILDFENLYTLSWYYCFYSKYCTTVRTHKEDIFIVRQDLLSSPFEVTNVKFHHE